MNINRIDFEDYFAQGDDYWRHVGIAEDVIKKGAIMGLISDSDAKRAIRMIDSQASTPGGGQTLFAADMLAAPAIMENPQEFKSWFNGMMNKGTKEQQGLMQSQGCMVTTRTLCHPQLLLVNDIPSLTTAR